MLECALPSREWLTNDHFVQTKLKKGLHRQEQEIRDVWVRIDTDASETLDSEEFGQMVGRTLDNSLQPDRVLISSEALST
eukprot:SAG22_NODE_21450_length_257_cov_0.639241_1_plen_80_part_00